MKSILKYSFILTLALSTFCAVAQDHRGNLPTYYKKRMNFGFTIGVNRANFIIHEAPHFERFDTLKSVVSIPKFGFNLGIVSELMLHQYITLRFVPNLSFAERNLQYSFEGFDTIVRKKTIESTFLNFPLDLKLRSKRLGNFGAYILAGGSYSLDLASKRKAVNSTDPNEQIVKLKRDDFGYEIGAGAEFYLEYFKFAIEGKLSIGTRDLLIKDNTIYSNSINKLNSKVFLISITFEG
ncbi:MAG: PorT family protein [Bacteroidetes bacterium]|nr:PorT family protein [Bacteroidota bacterium]